MKYLILVLVVVVFQSPKEIETEGKWQAIRAVNSVNENCDEKAIENTWFSFEKGNKFTFQQQYNRHHDPEILRGTYKMSEKELTINYTISGKQISYPIPILALENDRIVLDYCICPDTDLITPAKLVLSKVKQ